MRIEFEGRTWQYDEDKVTVQQAMAFHLVHGLTILAWQQAIAQMDPRAMQCCYWLMHQQAGDVFPLKECDFPVIEFIAAYRAAQDAEDGEEPEPDPTQPPPDGPQGEPTESKTSATPKGTTRPHHGQREAATAS